MLAQGDRVLVAVSGGPDSAALLSVLAELSDSLGVSLLAAHFNHGLRGAEADRDQQVAEQLCERLGVSIRGGRAAGESPRANLEEHARVARYDFLIRAARELGCSRIATGHTRDDQAETVIMRLLRGSGVDGMAGIQPRRADGVIRPLIECERAEILQYLGERDLPYCSDSMNADMHFLRSRVRHEVMPLLRSINPSAAGTLARSALNVGDDADALNHFVDGALDAASDEAGALIVANVRRLPTVVRGPLLRRWLARRRGARGLTAAHVSQAGGLLDDDRGSKEVCLPGGDVVVREYDRVLLKRACRGAGAMDQTVRAGASIELDCGWRLSAELLQKPKEVPARERTLWHFWADAGAIEGELRLRNARRGDRIQPLGLDGHRRLHDVFVDRKLPRSQRWQRPLLEVDGRILWVPGIVRSNHALISAATGAAWRVVIEVSAVAGR
jgi:tRNA(Ile)-lysidine synthase